MPVSLFGVLSCIVLLADNPDATWVVYCVPSPLFVIVVYVLIVLFVVMSREGVRCRLRQLLSCLIFFRCSYLPRPLAGIPPAILDNYSYCCSNWF